MTIYDGIITNKDVIKEVIVALEKRHVIVRMKGQELGHFIKIKPLMIILDSMNIAPRVRCNTS